MLAFAETLGQRLSFIEPCVQIYFPRLWYDSSRTFPHAQTNTPKHKLRKTEEPVSSTSRRGARAAYHDEYPRDFGPRIAYTVS